MKLFELSNASLKKLEQLRRSRGFVNKILGRYDTESDILLDLAGSGEVGLIPRLADYACGAEPKLRKVAEFAVSRLFETLPVDQWMNFEVASRSLLEFESYHEAGAWSLLSPDRFRQLLEGGNVEMMGFASMHPNGRVREVAIRALTGLTDGRELAFLLLRANDWVKPIREIAREAIKERFRPAYATELLRCLPVVQQLERCRRASHGWISEALGNLLNEDECVSVLQSGLRSQSVRTRRFCLKCLEGEPSMLRAELVSALKDLDPWIRLLAVQKLMVLKDEAIFLSLWRVMRNDSFMPLRREALYARNQVVDGELRLDLLGALLDRHHAVRSAARFFLGKEFDAAAWYRVALNENCGARLAAAIQGLGECGDDADADLLAEFLRVSELRIRKAAIVSVGRLSAKRYIETLQASLLDASPGVSRSAMLALLPVVSEIDPRWIEAHLQQDYPLHIQKGLLSLAARTAKWERISLMLRACRASDKGLANLACIRVQKWISQVNRESIRATKEQIAHARSELEQSKAAFDEHTYRLLEFIIRD